MKNNIISIISLRIIKYIVLLAVSGSLYAYNSHDYKVYLGLGLERNYTRGQYSPFQIVQEGLGGISLSPSQYSRIIDGKSGIAGLNLHNFGIEFGYTLFNNIYYPTLTFREIGFDRVTGVQKGYNWFADSIFYYQFYRNFVAKLHMGVGFLNTKYTVISNYTAIDPGEFSPGSFTTQSKTKFEDQRFGFRIGCGIQWNFAKNWSTEFNYVWQNGNGLLKHLQTIRAGVNYYIPLAREKFR